MVLKGDHVPYPQWEDINADMAACFKMYHKELLDAGYEIKAMNIVKKEEILYWILMGSDGPYIEAYGKLVNGDTLVRIDPKEHSVRNN